jgi:hypothetical protein
LTFTRNKNLADQFSEKYDIVFLGDYITEHWAGTDLAFATDAWQEVNKGFLQYFTKVGGGKVDGLALGIGGDRVSPNLHWLEVTIFVNKKNS